MPLVKSFSVGNGDTFYIWHGSDNFTIIDCCLGDERREEIIEELVRLSSRKGITRFISTHPDEDHIRGLTELDDALGLLNFYCVKNATTKEDATESFERYVYLRDGDKAFNIFQGCRRRWMSDASAERGSSGLRCLWPDTKNEEFKDALLSCEDGASPNNISPILQYSLEGGATFMWMGDLETEFMEAIEDEVTLSEIDILFAPHHGRESGKVPSTWLDKLDPQLIVVGEAPSTSLDYYAGWNTITQNSAGDIEFQCTGSKVHLYVGSDTYGVDFLKKDEPLFSGSDLNYLGTLEVG